MLSAIKYNKRNKNQSHQQGGENHTGSYTNTGTYVHQIRTQALYVV